ncbi:MAG: phosphate ABC transporter permease subunit PstC [Chloroflexota bacterium]
MSKLDKNPSTSARDFNLARRPRIRETLIQGFLFLCGALSILVTIGIVYELGKEALLFLSTQQWENTNNLLIEDLSPDSAAINVNVGESGILGEPGDIIRINEEIIQINVVSGNQYIVERGIQDTNPVAHAAGTAIYSASKLSFTDIFLRTEWNPQIGKFGIWALINATLITAIIANIVAIPLGLGVAIYLSEYASSRVRSVIKPILEVLAGIPTVVYGYFALTFMTPLLRNLFGSGVVQIYNTASAGIVIGILILPLVSSMSEDALSAVPRSLREASYALGATKLETAVRIILPAALSGITAAIIIAISRSIGETMIVAIAAGAGPSFTFNPFEAAETMSGHIVRISGGDLSYDSIDYNSIFAIGMMLFLITLTLNIFSQQVVNRFRQE